MKCPTDRSPMSVLASVVSADEKLLLTTHYCPACVRRVVRATPNPRYVPVIAPESRTENAGARTTRIKRMDEGYVPKPCCAKCGEVMREKTVDNLCHTCAEVAA